MQPSRFESRVARYKIFTVRYPSPVISQSHGVMVDDTAQFWSSILVLSVENVLKGAIECFGEEIGREGKNLN